MKVIVVQLTASGSGTLSSDPLQTDNTQFFFLICNGIISIIELFCYGLQYLLYVGTWWPIAIKNFTPLGLNVDYYENKFI